MNCSECGQPLADDARVCSACGRRVTPEAPPKSVLEPPPMPRARLHEAPGARRPGFEPTSRRMEPTGQPALHSPATAAAPGLSGFSRVLHKLGPAGMVVLGMLVALAAYVSARHDDAVAKAGAARRMSRVTEAPKASPDVTPGAATFSTQQALQGLYGNYDSHLEGVFWTVSGAPREWGEWNGKPVFIKPLISRSDDSGTRHVLVTNSMEIRDGLVVKEGAACPGCKSLLGAALFERRGDDWVLVTEHRFMKIGGAFGAPPKVTIDFPLQAGVEVRIESASTDGGRTRGNVHAVILHGGKPASAPVLARTGEDPARQTTPEPAPAASRTVQGLVAAAISGRDKVVERISSELKARGPERGDRTSARSLNERGLALARRQSYAEAASVFREARAADPGDAEIRENLGYALLKAERLTEAETALLSALEIGPTRTTAWGSLGHIYAKQGRREDAIALLRTAYRMASDPKRVLDTYARQAETETDPRVREMLAEAVTRISSPR